MALKNVQQNGHVSLPFLFPAPLECPLKMPLLFWIHQLYLLLIPHSHNFCFPYLPQLLLLLLLSCQHSQALLYAALLFWFLKNYGQVTCMLRIWSKVSCIWMSSKGQTKENLKPVLKRFISKILLRSIHTMIRCESGTLPLKLLGTWHWQQGGLWMRSGVVLLSYPLWKKDLTLYCYVSALFCTIFVAVTSHPLSFFLTCFHNHIDLYY